MHTQAVPLNETREGSALVPLYVSFLIHSFSILLRYEYLSYSMSTIKYIGALYMHYVVPCILLLKLFFFLLLF